MFIRLENYLQRYFYNTACFFTGDSLDPEVVYRARERPLFRKKAQFLIPCNWLYPIQTVL